MFKVFTGVVFVLLTAFVLINLTGEEHMDWTLLYEKPLKEAMPSGFKIVVETRDPPGEIRMFRGTTKMPFSIDKVAFAVSDPEARKNWVERLSDDVLIDGQPEEGEWRSYEWYNLSWPVSDREYVFSNTMKKVADADQTQVIVTTHSIEHPDYPQRADRVRGDLPKCVYTLTQKPDSEETLVEVVVQVDPAGSLPGFLVNLIQRDWALKTLRALNGHLEK
jgi:hypothetical protein